jgi:microcystin-dependent protein
MATNEILTFAQAGGANVLTQAAYAADAQTLTGNQPGIARAQLVNKALRQSSAVAAGVAQFLADFQVTAITDSLTPAQYSTIMRAALSAAGVFTTQSPGDNTTKAATTAFVTAAVNSAISAGAVAHFPGTAAPTGYLKANGALLSRVTYANLYAYAVSSGNMAASDGAWTSGQFSPGDGSTTFRIPDLRGYHVRAWDDARGVDSSRAIGSIQADQFPSHTHGVTDPGHAHGVYDPGHSHVYTMKYITGGSASGGDPMNLGTQNFSTSHQATGIGIYGAATGISIDYSGAGTETRVKNIALLACIKF